MILDEVGARLDLKDISDAYSLGEPTGALLPIEVLRLCDMAIGVIIIVTVIVVMC